MDPTLTAGAVRLEPLTPAHLAALVRARSSGSEEAFAFAFSSAPASEDGMRAWIAAALARKAAGEVVPFAIVDRAREEVVGSTRFVLERFVWPDGRAPRGGAPDAVDAVEIGWTWLAPHAQGTALNATAKLLMLTHAFETWRVVRVSFKTDARNERSRRAVLRLGARLDGVLRAWGPSADGACVRDTAFFSILDHEWPAVKRGLDERLRAGAPNA